MSSQSESVDSGNLCAACLQDGREEPGPHYDADRNTQLCEDHYARVQARKAERLGRAFQDVDWRFIEDVDMEEASILCTRLANAEVSL